MGKRLAPSDMPKLVVKRQRMTVRVNTAARGWEMTRQGSLPGGYSRWYFANATGIGTSNLTWTAANQETWTGIVIYGGSQVGNPMVLEIADSGGQQLSEWNWTPALAAPFFRVNIPKNLNCKSIVLKGLIGSATPPLSATLRSFTNPL